jgi:hypothetical protein
VLPYLGPEIIAVIKTPPTCRADKCVDTLPLVRFQQFLLMWKFPLAVSGKTIRKPCHGD